MLQTGIASKLPHELPIGLVLPSLSRFQALVHKVVDAPWVAQSEISFSAPLYQGTPEIRKDLHSAVSALDKFDVYFERGILDDDTRVLLAHAFRSAYLKRHPRSEERDVFFASGEVMQVKFSLHQPVSQPYVDSVLFEIQDAPHDRTVTSRIESGRGIDGVHLTGALRMYLHNVKNPRWRQHDAVRQVMHGDRADPVVVELITSGAIPGYFLHFLSAPVHEVGGAVAWLET